MTNIGIQVKRLLLKLGYVVWVKKEWSESLKELEYSCGLDGRTLSWRAVSQHYRFAHEEVYDQIVLMAERRDFKFNEELVLKDGKTSIPQNMSIELKQVRPRAIGYTLPQIEIVNGKAHCECGGKYKNNPSDKKEHEKTHMHQKYLQRIIDPIPINVLSYGNHR